MIIASLQDPEYAKKYREKRYIPVSKWEWGIGDDGALYCRDEADFSLFPTWILVNNLLLNFDIDTIHRLSRWSTSLIVKSKVKSFMDREILRCL